MKEKKIQAATDFKVIGTFEGISADAEITNRNGLDITRKVWENVFSSEDYKRGIKNGWFIGFLGHPEDPGCMDFEHGCIVMTDGYIDDAGKIHAKFNLIDTPVGITVKKFIDGGVTWGISVRGAGDIEDNSVNPDTFTFRGFDLVSFPAYDEAVPTFTEIAASTDVNAQTKYKNICNAVRVNLDSIASATSIKMLQEQFAPQSEEYALLGSKMNAILKSTEEFEEDETDIDDEKIKGMTNLFMQEKEKNTVLAEENKKLQKKLEIVEATYQRKLKSMERIFGSQVSGLTKEIDTITASYDSLHRKNKVLMNKNKNLIYNQKETAKKHDSIVSSLRSRLDKTVIQASTLDTKNQQLSNETDNYLNIIQDYQDNYAALYASILGVELKSLSISEDTTAKELESKIENATNTSNVFVKPDIIDMVEPEEDENDLITV